MFFTGIRDLISIGICALMWPHVQAQTGGPIFPLEGVEIVSDRLGLPENRTGRHITVIKGEDILKLPIHSLDELLRSVPFLEIQSRGGFGVQSDILLRGGTFNQVLVLVDGMRINDPLTGHFNSYIPVPLTEISKIEVYRGPASSLYGPDAVGGVIHIITKSFFPAHAEEENQVNGRLETWYGQHNLVSSNSGLHIRKGPIIVGAGISFNRSDGHKLSTDTLRGDFRLATVSLSASFKLSDKVLAGIRTAYDSRLFNARYFYTNSPADMSREQVEKWWNQVFIRFRLNSTNTLTFQTGYQTTTDSFLFNPVFLANIHRTHYYNYQVNHLFTPVSGFRLSTGIQADHNKVFSSDRGNHNSWHTGGYIILSGNILSNGSLSGGTRMDYDPAYGLELLPQMNAAWSVNKWILRGALGRSVRSPDFTERYVSTGLEGPLSPGRNLGNPNLLAERSWSIEAGFDRALFEGVQLKATGFYRFSRDLIDYVMTVTENISNNKNLSPGESYFWARNIGMLNTGGLEIQIDGIHDLGEGLRLEWGAAYQALNNQEGTDLVSKYLSNHARDLVNTRIAISNTSVRMQLMSLYKRRDAAIAEIINESIEPSYTLFDLRADLYFFHQRFMLSLQANNLFNRSYADVLGARMPGRWISGGLTWSFTDK